MVGAVLGQHIGSTAEVTDDELQHVGLGVEGLTGIVDHGLVALEENVGSPAAEQIEVSPATHEIALANDGPPTIRHCRRGGIPNDEIED